MSGKIAVRQIMVKSIIKFFKNPLLWSFLIPTILMLAYFAYRGMAPFGDSTILTVDLGQQSVDFFAEIKNAILSDPNRLFYTFSKGLGGSMLDEWATYYTSPLNLVFLLVKPAQIQIATLFLTVIRYGLMGLSMAYALKAMNLQRGIGQVIFGVAYAFNGWIVATQVVPQWIDIAILLPLIVWQFERLIFDNKKSGFILLLAAAFLINYYAAFMVVIFLIALFFWETTRIKQNFKSFLKLAFNFAVSGIIAAGISAFLLLPTIYQLILGKAQQTGENFSWEFNKLVGFNIFAKLIPGSFDFEEMKDGAPNIFIAFVILIAAIGYFSKREVSALNKIITTAIIGFYIVSFLWKPLTMFMHGMQSPVWYPFRYSFIFVFFLILLAANTFNADFKLKISTSIISGILATAILTIGLLRNNQLTYISSLGIYFFAVLAAFTFGILLISKRDNNWLIIILSLVTASGFLHAVLTLNTFSYLTNDEYTRAVKTIEKIPSVLPSQEKDFFRVGKTFNRDLNDPLMGNYNGGDHFASTVDASMTDLYHKLGLASGDYTTVYSYGTMFTDSFLSFRYFIGPSRSEQTEGDPLNLMDSYRPDIVNYPVINKIDQAVVLENPNALPIIFASNPKIANVSLDINHPINNQNDIANGIFGSQEEFFESVTDFDIELVNLRTNAKPVENLANGESLDHQKNYVVSKNDLEQPAAVKITFTPTTDNPYYLNVGNGLQGDNVDIRVNGRKAPRYPDFNNDVIFAATKNSAGKEITIEFSLIKDNVIVNHVALFSFDQSTYSEKVSSIQEPIFHKINSRMLDATVTFDDTNNFLMTTIPYAPGWSAEIDGKKVDLTKTADLFIGLKAKSGTHRIKLIYTPPLFVIGAIISMMSIILLVFLRHFHLKKME